MILNGNAGSSPSFLGCVYVKAPILPARGACSELDVALFLPPPFLKGRRGAEEAETLTKPHGTAAEPCPRARCPPGPYSQEERARSVPLPQAAHGHQLPAAESVLTWDPRDSTEGALSAEPPRDPLPLNISPSSPPPPPPHLPAALGTSPGSAQMLRGAQPRVQKQGLICRLAPR